jgi:hypothetical protein
MPDDPPPLGLDDLGAADGPAMDTDGMGEGGDDVTDTQPQPEPEPEQPDEPDEPV